MDQTQTANREAPPRRAFLEFAQSVQTQSVLRDAITAAYRRPEAECVALLIEQARLPDTLTTSVDHLARALAQKIRSDTAAHGHRGLVQGLVQEFSLSSQEGVALMCLAEALLRIPDRPTRDALIRDKISHGDWQAHLGHSPSLFVNAATWGLLISGKLVATHNETGLSAALARLIGKGGEPLIRKGVDSAMRMMGEHFVTGETILEALANARRLEDQGFGYSYDMLGEAAMTEADAQRYLRSYEQAIDAIGRAAVRLTSGRGIYAGPGISIKLSALHPRYSRAQHERVMNELYPRVKGLVCSARSHDIGINIDAEEADRLELSLDLLERLCAEPELAGWNGIGFVVQAYQKRCPYLIDHLIDLARRSRHRIMVRLVKGAYWDSEIKRAQVDGLEGYPVYTRKAYTDLSYLACARKLLAVPEAIYPQFATHNAHTLAAVYQMAGQNYYPGRYEFQCLHGMGETLYRHVVGPLSEGKLNRACRIYAPVGTHQTLLAYLVRRLLENGANTSFVNRIADHTISLDALVEDPVSQVEQLQTDEGSLGLPHPRIPLPRELYGAKRVNSAGIDLSNEQRLASLSAMLLNSTDALWHAGPMLGRDGHADKHLSSNKPQPIFNPSDPRDQVGWVIEADADDVTHAMEYARKTAPVWQSTPSESRAAALDRTAHLMEAQMQSLIGLIVREAGKTFANAIAEVREAVDFLRYYAAQIRTGFSNDTHRPLGPVVCISPWNFPLAIFTGQVSAALAAGNPVLAKPAEQTPLIAAAAVRLFHEAGIPAGALQLLPGRGETVGAQLVAHAAVRGVLFTGSTEVARRLQRSLAGRLDSHGHPVPLVAETGGLNAMIVDSSALTEQVVADVLQSAFDSAGQRCSALRVLCLQEDIADRVLTMLKGAMAHLVVGNPDRLSTDVGPVIDTDARAGVVAHIEAMRQKGRSVHQVFSGLNNEECAHGNFVLPTLIELDHISELTREVFGPVLHVVRYARDELDALLNQINATGYGLTLGVHSRIDETVERVAQKARVGNLYVNRNVVGAVVGVQPFGGEGLSGTGPKAGGPLYLLRLLSTRPVNAASLALMDSSNERKDSTLMPTQTQRAALADLIHWANAAPDTATLVHDFEHFSTLSNAWLKLTLAGPTGEHNTYTLIPREAVLCLAQDESDRLTQIAAVLAAVSRVIWPADASHTALFKRLPSSVQAQISMIDAYFDADFDAVLHHGDADQLVSICARIAERPGPIISVQGLRRGDCDIALEGLMIERSQSVNTVAAGGNASLMAIG